MIAAVPLILFPFCLIAAALSDARRFLIPNRLTIALALGFFLAAAVIGMEWSLFVNHLLTGFGMLVVGFGLFCIADGKQFAAGDAKLLTAVALWFGWPTFLTTAVIVCFVGGAMTIGIIAMWTFARWFPLLSMYMPSLAGLAAKSLWELKCPYGVAISIGALITFQNSPIFEALAAMAL